MILKKLSQALVLVALALNFSCVNEDITDAVPDKEKNTPGTKPQASPDGKDIFPLSVKNGKLITHSGQPFLIIGDSPWSLIVGPDKNGIDKYLENREQKGVNSLLINLIEHYYNGPADASGNLPFLVDGDFNTPNAAYFDNADYVIGKAREMNMEVFLFPAYLGYDDGASHEEGWYSEVNANGPAKMYQYGKYLGRRYKSYDNIIWVMGGDCAPADAIDEIRDIVRGIEEEAGPQLFTVHNGRFQSGLTAYAGEKWIDLNSTYASESTAAFFLKPDFQRGFPFYFIEGTYENAGATPAQLRGQMYLPVLMGANGYFYGNYPLFNFGDGWDNPAYLESQGSNDLRRSAEFFLSRSWHKLIPDINHALLTSGYGDIGNSSYGAAGLTQDGSSAVIYVPDYRELTVNLTLITGAQTHAWWYQPSTGDVTDLELISDSPSQSFIPPSAGDWLLVLDDATKGLPAPGTIN